MAQRNNHTFTILAFLALTAFYACTGKAPKKKQSIPVPIPADTTQIRLEKVQQSNTVTFKKNTVTHCAATEQQCRSDINFISSSLELIDPDYKTTTLEAAIYQGIAVLNNTAQDSLSIYYYRIKTEHTGVLQQQIIRMDTAGEGYVRKLARTEAPVACYFTTTPDEILLITHIGLPGLQKLKNKPLVAAVKEQINEE